MWKLNYCFPFFRLSVQLLSHVWLLRIKIFPFSLLFHLLFHFPSAFAFLPIGFLSVCVFICLSPSCSSTLCVWKWKWNLLSCVSLFVTPWTVACQVPLFMEFSRQEYWSGLPFPSPYMFDSYINSFKMSQLKLIIFFITIASSWECEFSSVQFSHSVVSNSLWPHGL